MHADPLDVATMVSEIATQDALDRTRRLAAPEQVQNADGTWPTTDCVDCGEPIETPRLELGKLRCITCQIALERKQKYGSR